MPSAHILIENVTLPNGVNTCVVEIGSTFGALAAGESLTIDPTFGYETEGGTTQNVENFVVGSQYSLSEAGTLTSGHMYLQATRAEVTLFPVLGYSLEGTLLLGFLVVIWKFWQGSRLVNIYE